MSPPPCWTHRDAPGHGDRPLPEPGAGITVIHITHFMEEAVEADRVS